LDDCGDWGGDCGGGCDWCEWDSWGFGGWFPGMPIGVVLPAQLPQQPSPCNFIVCADSGGIDNFHQDENRNLVPDNPNAWDPRDTLCSADAVV